jgi:photosystem II stability/assembly factor-like uncharacterized protein
MKLRLNHLSRRNLLLVIVCLFALTTVTSIVFRRSNALVGQFTAPELAPQSAEAEQDDFIEPDGEKAREDPFGREDWFYFQRAYPFESLPEAGRRLAWDAALDEQARFRTQASAADPKWLSIGPSPTRSAFPDNWGLTSGRINTVAISPADPKLILIGGSTGGIWRSTDGGETFVTVTDDQVDLAVGSIAFAPSEPNTVYAGMGDARGGYLGSGVLKSTDAGLTWQRINNQTLREPGRNYRVVVDPKDASRVYLAQRTQVINGTAFSSGLNVSTDGGVNWRLTWRGIARDVALQPGNPQIVYAAFSRVDEPGSLPPGLYKSSDRGETWTQLYATPYVTNGTADVRVALSKANPQRIYVYTGGVLNNSADLRVMVSDDGGATWTKRGSVEEIDLGQFGYNTYIEADPENADTVYVGARDVFKSTDAGRTWVNLNNAFKLDGTYTPRVSNAHPDQHALTFSPQSSTTLYLGNDGGLYKSEDGGRTYRSLNSTLSLTQFVGYQLHPTRPDISYGGTQDNGNQVRAGNSGQWNEFFGGDGGNCVINPLDPSQIFMTYILGTIIRFGNNGERPERIVGNELFFGESQRSPRIAFYPPFTGNGVDSTLYFGTWRLFISRDLGNTWYAPGWGFDLTRGVTTAGADVLTAIGVSGANPDVIYTGSALGRVMVTANRGVTWRDVTAGLPNRFIKSLTVSRNTPTMAYLTVSGFNSGHVYRTTNSGATWTDLSANLPNIPANAFLIDPKDEQTLYVGTDIGVFRSTNGGASWQLFNNGIPPVIINAFSAQASGLIQVATYGRGAFELSQPTQAENGGTDRAGTRGAENTSRSGARGRAINPARKSHD